MRTPFACLLALPLIFGFFGSDESESPATREVSVRYLNVAIGSLEDKTPLTLEARYGGDLSKTPLWSGHSQFSLIDPESGQAFSFAVCETGDEIFDVLLNALPGTLYRVDGVKFKMAGKFYDCIIVSGLTELGPPPQPEQTEPHHPGLRLTITHEDGTREVIRNLEPGDTFEVDGKTIQVETEPN